MNILKKIVEEDPHKTVLQCKNGDREAWIRLERAMVCISGGACLDFDVYTDHFLETFISMSEQLDKTPKQVFHAFLASGIREVLDLMEKTEAPKK